MNYYALRLYLSNTERFYLHVTTAGSKTAVPQDGKQRRPAATGVEPARFLNLLITAGALS